MLLLLRGLIRRSQHLDVKRDVEWPLRLSARRLCRAANSISFGQRQRFTYPSRPPFRRQALIYRLSGVKRRIGAATECGHTIDRSDRAPGPETAQACG